MHDLKPENMKYGLIVIDPTEAQNENDESTILHFCGYETQPTQSDVNSLFEELSTNEDFGLTDKMDIIEIYDAPQEIVDMYREGLLNGEITSIETHEDEDTFIDPNFDDGN